MKKFKEFLKGKLSSKPTLITAQPVHGSHAKPSVKPIKEGHSDYAPDVKKWFGTNANHHLGDHDEHTHEKLDHPEHHFNKIPGIQHVKDYTDESYQTNSELIAKASGKKSIYHTTKDDTDMKKAHMKRGRARHNRDVKGIDKAIASEPLKHDVHVYHGTSNWNPGHEAAKNEHNTIHMASYTSASIKKKIAHGFATDGERDGDYHGEHGAHVLHIHMKKGQHGLYVGSHSMSAHEHEMVLPRDTHLKIHPKPHKMSDGTHVWHAHVVDHK